MFQGRIIVRPDAQKTDAKMMTRALLLSDEAEADNKPELEIFADDVTCGHGATTGALDESLLFYLQARGLPEKEAQALLIQAFVGEAIESIASEPARARDLGGAALAGGTGMTMHPAVLNGSYDVARVREDFPALALKVYGKPLVYLDNAASAQKPNAVLDRMTQAYKSEYANVHRGLHYLANAATEAYEGGRAKVAKFLNAPRNEEIIFTRNATEAINLVVQGHLVSPNLQSGNLRRVDMMTGLEVEDDVYGWVGMAAGRVNLEGVALNSVRGFTQESVISARLNSGASGPGKSLSRPPDRWLAPVNPSLASKAARSPFWAAPCLRQRIAVGQLPPLRPGHAVLEPFLVAADRYVRSGLVSDCRRHPGRQ